MDIVKLKKMEDSVRIGGKGSVRRKHKHVQTSSNLEEKRLQATLGKLSLNQMPGIQQISVQMKDGNEIIVPMPKVQGSVVSNLFVITGELVRVPSVAKKEAEAAAAAAQAAAAAAAQAAQAAQTGKTGRQLPGQGKETGKKGKKPRNRIRCRNKRAQMLQHLVEAGDSGAQPNGGGDAPAESEDRQGGGDFGPKEAVDDNISTGSQNLSQDLAEDGSNLSADSDKTNVPSDSSDMDQTLVGDDESLAGDSIFSQPASKGSDNFEDGNVATELDFEMDAGHCDGCENVYMNYDEDHYNDDEDALNVNYNNFNHDDDEMNANYEQYNHNATLNIDLNNFNNDNDAAASNANYAEPLIYNLENFNINFENLSLNDNALNDDFEAFTDQIAPSSEKESFEDEAQNVTEEDVTEIDAEGETEDGTQEEAEASSESESGVCSIEKCPKGSLPFDKKMKHILQQQIMGIKVPKVNAEMSPEAAEKEPETMAKYHEDEVQAETEAKIECSSEAETEGQVEAIAEVPNEEGRPNN